jgi:hypothetical protein
VNTEMIRKVLVIQYVQYGSLSQNRPCAIEASMKIAERPTRIPNLRTSCVLKIIQILQHDNSAEGTYVPLGASPSGASELATSSGVLTIWSNMRLMRRRFG